MVRVLAARNAEGCPSVCVVLSQGDITLDKNDVPVPGVALSPDNARRLALLLNNMADKVELG